jgi:hypothetical protein
MFREIKNFFYYSDSFELQIFENYNFFFQFLGIIENVIILQTFEINVVSIAGVSCHRKIMKYTYDE